MRSRAVRLTLTLLALAAISGAGYYYWINHTRDLAIAQRAAAFDHVRTAASRHAFELRSSQQVYVAAGQSEAFWFEKVSASAEALKAAINTLAASTAATDVRAALDEAMTALQEFEERDRRVRGYASSGQRLLASDIIFSDSLESGSQISAALEQAGTAAARANGDERTAASRNQMMAAAAAAASGLLAMLLLVPLRAAPAAAPVQPAEPARRADDTLGLRMRSSAGRDEKTARAAGPAAPARVEKSVPAAASPAAATQAARSRETAVEIQSLASVCTDLARLTDTSTMPAILERTAAALDATGLVLWIADAGGKHLMPIAAHGYPGNVLSRMGSLETDAENATAAAFRTGLVQTVSANGTSNGAIAAPLVSASGCLGVISAEVRHNGETQPARLAAAAIVAAQLATLVGPPAEVVTETPDFQLPTSNSV